MQWHEKLRYIANNEPLIKLLFGIDTLINVETARIKASPIMNADSLRCDLRYQLLVVGGFFVRLILNVRFC